MIAIIKYNAGNVQSVQNALTRLGYNSIVTNNPAEIMNADKVIFPGVGEAKSAMTHLKESGLDVVLKNLKQPVLGICLGLQLMCSSSEEGDTECLGIFPNRVRRFVGEAIIPHMGWNNFEIIDSSWIKGISANDNVYYVHSYFADLGEYTVATCDYINPFSAVLHKDNFYAMQFHPEKSASTGETLLKNFLEL